MFDIFIQRIASLAEIIYFKKATFIIDRSSLGAPKRHKRWNIVFTPLPTTSCNIILLW